MPTTERTYFFSGINRPGLVRLLAAERAAGMVNMSVAGQPALMKAFTECPNVRLAMDSRAFAHRRRKKRSPDERERYLDSYARTILKVGARFEWWSSPDEIGDQEQSNRNYEDLLARLEVEELRAKVLWVYQGSESDLAYMAGRTGLVGLGGLVHKG
jgi:hypothetical protein